MEPSSSQPAHASSANPFVSVIIVLLALVIVLGALIWKYPPATRVAQRVYSPLKARAEVAWAAYRLPSDLRAAYFSTGQATYRVTHLSLVPATPSLASQIQKVYQFPFNAMTVKANPRLSAGKTHVAFQQQTDSQLAARTDGWQVSVAAVQNGDQRALGKGVQPFFIDETHVARFTPDGLVMTDIAAASTTDTVLMKQPFVDAAFSLAVSPNQSVVAYANSAKNHVEVYSVRASGASLVTTYDGPATSFALSDTALYVLHVMPAGTTVVRVPFTQNAAPQVVDTFPGVLGINALAF